jgi:hypothetical protein
MEPKKKNVSMETFSDTSLHTYAYVALSAYLALGVGAYHVFFGWSLIDTIYFTVVQSLPLGTATYVPRRTKKRSSPAALPSSVSA